MRNWEVGLGRGQWAGYIASYVRDGRLRTKQSRWEAAKGCATVRKFQEVGGRV